MHLLVMAVTTEVEGRKWLPQNTAETCETSEDVVINPSLQVHQCYRL